MYVQRKRKKKPHGGTNILLKCLVVRPTRTYKCQTPIQLTSWTWDMNCMYEISFLAREHSPKLFLVWEYPVFFLKLLEVCVHVLLSDPMSSVGQPRPAVNVLAEEETHRRKHVWLKFWNYGVRRPIQRPHPSACTTDETPISFSVVVVSLSPKGRRHFFKCALAWREKSYELRFIAKSILGRFISSCSPFWTVLCSFSVVDSIGTSTTVSIIRLDLDFGKASIHLTDEPAWYPQHPTFLPLSSLPWPLYGSLLP